MAASQNNRNNSSREDAAQGVVTQNNGKRYFGTLPMQTLPLEAIVRMQPKGVITIPKKIRDAVGLKEGMYLRVTVDGQRIALEPIRLVPYHPK